jgi:hypothetical protein
LGIACHVFQNSYENSKFYKETFTSKLCYQIKDRSIILDTTKSYLQKVANSELFKKMYVIDTSYKYKIRFADSKHTFNRVLKKKYIIGYRYCETSDNFDFLYTMTIAVLLIFPFTGLPIILSFIEILKDQKRKTNKNKL